ncbi:hypothetical protein EYM_05945 [Ignicoccus islandicus DSM 13165]|uniref:CYTH domain-containing protein n=1 Tax=Ignicoccus islandicus DSM 13165 TaxID=940295 RepID=A0A0U3F9C6_9CREN|nr:hypothetical protein [Ignicoccus islandicus]ALU12632.1 hypothetical protein EYM_05945 [Ignicoccus islandicus DSM 13165]
MVKPFEVEARFLVDERFLEKLLSMGFKVIREYAFTDYFYEPPSGWKGNKALRIRDWGNSCEVLFDSIDVIETNGIKVKRSKFKEGKVKLYEGSRKECEKLLEEMEFQRKFVIEKERGYLLNNGRYTVALERILGKWVLEVEVNGEDLEKAVSEMKRIMRELGLERPVATTTRELVKILESEGRPLR